MPLSQANVYARLDSELFGALVQVVEIAALATHADVAAGRIYQPPRNLPTSYSTARRLELTREQDLALQSWPEQTQGLFAHLPSLEPPGAVFRPCELDLPVKQADAIFPEITRITHVMDCLCTCIPVVGETCVAVALLRCGDSPQFAPEMCGNLSAYQSAMARPLRTGYRLDVACEEGDSPPEKYIEPSEFSGFIHQRLSSTEQRVLTMLRQGLTERQIADQFDRSRHTIHVHVKSIYRKLNVSSKRQLLDLLSGGAMSPN